MTSQGCFHSTAELLFFQLVRPSWNHTYRGLSGRKSENFTVILRVQMYRSHSLYPYGCCVTQDCASLLVSTWKTSACKHRGLMEAGFRAILVDTSAVDKQWDGLKLPTPVKTGGTLCCTAGGAVSQHLEASNPVQLPAARPCLITARTALICCLASFISSHFYFVKKKKYPTMHWAVEISIFIFILFLYSITVISLHLPLSLTACTSKLSIMVCDNVCVPRCFFPFTECDMRAKFPVRKG